MRYKFEDIAVNSVLKRKPSDEDMTNYIGLEHLDTGSLSISRYGSKVPIKGEKMIMKKGDMLFGRRNTYLKRAAIAPHDGLFSAHGMILRPKENVISKDFFPFFISSDYFFDAAIRISVGSLSPTVNWGTLKNLEFNLPTLSEQRRLAKLLWSIVNTKQAYIKLLDLTDNLVRSQFIEMFGDPMQNEKGWQQTTISEICQQIQGGGTPSKSNPEYYFGDIPWVTPKDMKSEIISESIDHVSLVGVENSAIKIIPVNSILMVIRSGILKHNLPIAINTVPVTINQDMKAFIIGDNVTPEYLMFTLKTYKHFLLSNVRAVTADNIEFNLVKNLKIGIAPKELQNKFADFVRQANKSKFEIQRTLDELEAVYKSLLKENLG